VFYYSGQKINEKYVMGRDKCCLPTGVYSDEVLSGRIYRVRKFQNIGGLVDTPVSIHAFKKIYKNRFIQILGNL
jgi:hypothetical protein